MHRIWVAVLPFILGSLLAAQGASEGERRLDLKRAEIGERQALKKALQTRSLFAEGLQSRDELESAEAELTRAELDTQRARLTLSNELPSFRLLSATKSMGQRGEILVSLEVEELREATAGLGSRTYLVSLKSPTAIISEPYQRMVTVDGSSERRLRLDFRLLKDADELVVRVASGARLEEIPVLLQRGRGGALKLSASNTSLEGLVGDRADFRILLERFDPALSSLSLGVEGLPAGFATEWWEGEGKARVTSLRFLEGQNTKELLLRVRIPSEGQEAWLNRPITFRMHAIPDGAAMDLLRKAPASLDLQLRPTGAPRLVLGCDNLLLQMGQGEARRVTLWVENMGGAEAQNVSVEATLPLGFQGRLLPSRIPALGVRERRDLVLEVSPGREAVPGEFTIHVSCTADNRQASLEGPELAFRVLLKPTPGRSMVILLVAVLTLAATGYLAWILRGRRSPRSPA